VTKTLDQLYLEVKDCRKCGLCNTRTNLVFGVGDERADLMFVGEAPGFHEDQQGEPFVGAAGQLLDKLLASIDLKRSQVYIANVLKCRPPDNRDPLPEEAEACKPHLFEQIEIIKPRIVSTLGRHASQLLLERNVAMSKIHGKHFKRAGYDIFPIYHPAAALYARATLASLEEDFKQLKELLETGNQQLLQEPEQPQQMGLF
jgi:uracil-DNA glycosylase family 4